LSPKGPLRVEVSERIRRVVLDHGANALDSELLAALDATVASLERDGAPAFVLASAHPTVFCPGLDLKKLDGKSREVVRADMERFNTLLRRLAAYPGPTVAAIGGHAIAGGCLLAMACDRRVMARAGARIGVSEINLGIPVPAGAVRMLLALYPTRAIEQLVLEGDGFGGERALELGIVERLADPGMVLEDAGRLAAHLATRPADVFATAKGFLRRGLAEDMAEHDKAELDRFLDHWFSPDTQDRIGAIVAGL
jgi:enoyl-CoA hydratase